jgi:tetratricopeptide (TPR) repeat protein
LEGIKREREPAPTGMWNAIAGACFQLGRFDEAEEAMLAELAALEPQDRQYAEKLTNIFGNLSRVMMFHRRFDQAESNLRTFDGRLQQITDVDPELRLDCRSRLADLLIRSGKTDDAEVMLSELHAQSVAMLGPEHPRTLTVEFNSAVLCMDRKSDKAIPMFRDLIEKQTRVLGPAHEQTLRAVTNLGLAFMRTGQFVEAESLLEKSMIRAEEKYGADHQLSIMLRDRLRSIQSAMDREGGNRQDSVLPRPSAGIESPTPEPSS